MTIDPFQSLRAHAERVLVDAEPAHDFTHVLRVVKNAAILARAEGANHDICHVAALLHELVNLPKNHPESHRSGELCAQAAFALLDAEGFAADFRDSVTECIRVHAFSAGKTASTLEAQILQDADRLDAIGAIGIARCFATCASMKRPFHCPEDPFAHRREPNDKEFGIDHFFKKLLKIPERLTTQTARLLAEERVAFLRQYLQQLGAEIGVTEPLRFT
ncbi:MAG: HD domain-containing protein [Anaeromyxobacter sp.]